MRISKYLKRGLGQRATPGERVIGTLFTPKENGYCGINADCVRNLNSILVDIPDLKIVITSAWRYIMIGQQMTLKGFEYMLMVHGIDCRGRLHGHTDKDESPDLPQDIQDLAWTAIGLRLRGEQIRSYVARHGIKRYAVLDDLAIDADNFVKTDPTIGLTLQEAVKVVDILLGATCQK